MNYKGVLTAITLLAVFIISGSCDRAEGTKQDVLVVAHRGDWRNHCENSLEAIESSIEMGVDIVEIDLACTKDGYIVLMHDKTIDRTTTGTGRVEDYTLEQIKRLRLRNGQGQPSTQFSIPTLREAMLVAKGRIDVNLDKAEPYFDKVYEILEETGTLEQAIIKSPLPYSQLRAQFGENLDKMIFMPKIRLDSTVTFDSIRPLLEARYSMYEISFGEDYKELSAQIKRELEGSDSRIWINTLWESQCAGRCDDIALRIPDETWGYLVDSIGASAIQTDRPALLIDYLERRGNRGDQVGK